MKRWLKSWGSDLARDGIMITLAVCALTAAFMWLILLFSSPAEAQTSTRSPVSSTSFTTTCASSPCSGAAPTAVTDGRTLVDASGIKVRLCADEGETLSGAGTLDVYSYDVNDGLWALVPSLEIEVPADAASDRCVIVLEDRATLVPSGYVAVVPNGVTLSDGNLTVKISVTVKRSP